MKPRYETNSNQDQSLQHPFEHNCREGENVKREQFLDLNFLKDLYLYPKPFEG